MPGQIFFVNKILCDDMVGREQISLIKWQTLDDISQFVTNICNVEIEFETEDA